MNADKWPPVQLRDVAAFGSGTTPPRSLQALYFSGGTIPWVKTLDLNNAAVVTTDESVTELALEQTSLRVHPVGSVLVAMYGGYGQIGRTGVLRVPAATNQAITSVMPASGRLHPDFLLHVLNHRVRHWRSVASSSRKDPNITKEDVKAFPLRLPPIAEQKSIAHAINDAHELMNSLERVVVKKRAMQLGLMEDLLTGRVRLPGFNEAWAERPVSELLEFKNGLNKASQYFGHGTPIVNFMDVMGSTVIKKDRVNGLVSLSRDEIGRFSARRGDMFFTRTSETVEEIGTAAVLVDDIPDAVFSGFVLRGRPVVRVNTTFLAYQFRLPSIRRQVIATASYTTRALTNGGSLGRVRVLIPDADEQAAVVAALADAEADIVALERRLVTARAIKTGMMQALLTGRTRLPVGAAS